MTGNIIDYTVHMFNTKENNTVRTRKAKRYAPPRRGNRCAFPLGGGTASGHPWSATTSRGGARAPLALPHPPWLWMPDKAASFPAGIGSGTKMRC
jgi:hypothetical protein